MSTTLRKSNFELLRILAMFMVVWLHCNYFVFGGITSEEIEISTLNSFLRLFADQLCTPCVNLFILISGWFGIKSKFKGVSNILFQVLFYTCVCIFICWVLNWEFTISRIKAALTCQFAYWFIWPYILLYITAPVFNLIVKEYPNKALNIAIGILCFNFALDWIVYYSGGNGGKSYIAFVALYLLGRLLATQKYKILNYKEFLFGFACPNDVSADYLSVLRRKYD